MSEPPTLPMVLKRATALCADLDRLKLEAGRVLADLEAIARDAAREAASADRARRSADALQQLAQRQSLLTSREAAESLSITERTLWSHTKSGDIPAVRIGRAVRYDPKDLAAWLDRAKQRDRQAV